MVQIITPTDTERINIIDKINDNLSYVGTAQLGSAEDAAVWQIIRLQKSGNITHVQYADGNRKYDNIWDSRTSLTYTNWILNNGYKNC